MTTIEMLFGRPGADSALLSTAGTLVWTPTKAHDAGEAVVLPLPFTVKLPFSPTGLAVPFSVDVEPSGPGWAWKVEENFTGLRRRRVYVTVPDTGSINYRELVQVDLGTLLPTAAPVPAWYAYTDGLALAAGDARDAAAAAQASAAGSAGSAATSASTATDKAAVATTKATEAGLSAVGAASSATGAASSASAAFGRATAADESKLAAAASATAASGSATTAAGSATAAASSATSAASAKTGAETARDAAASSAATALSRANTAGASATSAQDSAAAAVNSAAAASGSATSAALSAGTATTKAAAATARAAEASSAASTASTAANTASAGAATAAAKAGEAVTSAATASSAKDQAVAAADGFSMGTVTTLPAGSAATANLSGVAPDRKINLSIPRGAVPNIQVGTVTVGAPQPSAGTPGATGLQGDMVTVIGPTANVSGTVTLASGDLPSTRVWTVTGNVTLVLPTPPNNRSGTITLIITQDATGNRTITWPAASVLKWPDGIAQQPAAAASTTSMIHLLWTGAVWLGMLGGKSFA